MSSDPVAMTGAASAQPETASRHPKREYIPAPEGAGPAAILMFLHVALIGYLGYAGVHIIRNWDVHIVIHHNMSWQYYIPAWFAALSYFPTDSLTRIVATAARAAGVTALLIALSLLMPPLFSGQPLVPIGRIAFVLLLWWPASLLCCYARNLLPAYRRS